MTIEPEDNAMGYGQVQPLGKIKRVRPVHIRLLAFLAAFVLRAIVACVAETAWSGGCSAVAQEVDSFTVCSQAADILEDPAGDPSKTDVAAKTAPAGISEDFEWRTAAPESQQMSSAKLEALWNDLRSRRTSGLIVIRNDRIVFEKYAEGWDSSKRHGTASMAKALVGGVALAVAISDRLIALDDAAANYIPAWRNDPRKSKITIRQLGSHTSGLDDAELADVPHEALPGWKGAFWKRREAPGDPFTIARDMAPVQFEPGSAMLYSNPGIGMMGYAVTSALKDAPQKDIRTLLRDRVMRPIGVPDEEWSAGYGTTTVVDGLPLVATWGGGSYTPKTVARVARLMLRRGDWDGTRLIDPGAVSQVTQDAGTPGNCGIGWWTNAGGSAPPAPQGCVFRQRRGQPGGPGGAEPRSDRGTQRRAARHPARKRSDVKYLLVRPARRRDLRTLTVATDTRPPFLRKGFDPKF